MITPTSDEIKGAREAIERDGPGSDMGLMMGLLVASNEPLRTYCERMAKGAPEILRGLAASKPGWIPDEGVLEIFVRGVFMGGMNYALRIAEERIKELSLDQRKANA